MELKLDKKVAVVTGGSSGIGRSAALALAKEGCLLAICGRDGEKLKRTRGDFVRQGIDRDSIYTFECDVSVPNGLDGFADAVYSRFGGIDVWVNNAGVGCSCTLREVDDVEFRRVVEADMIGVWRGMKAALRHMSFGGAIVNVASDQALLPSIDRFPYAAAKAGVITMTKTAAADLGPDGIRVNAVAPGLVVTEMNRRYMPDDVGFLTQNIALGRLGEAEDIARAIVFLASDMARYITGECITVNGGTHITPEPMRA